MNNTLQLFDSTLRDGAQGEGISFSVQDKLKILQSLDKMGLHFVEAGNPGSNPKDLEFFEQAKALPLTSAKLVAFGSTCRKFVSPADDANIQALLSAGTEYVTIFGKSWDMHVEHILHTTAEENLRMIGDTVRFLTEKGRRVIYDAEHFFDGYKANPAYALSTLRAAHEAGAEVLVLCETNGGGFPEEVYEATKAVMAALPAVYGIHAHNDCGCAVANSLAAVRAGAVQVQGTFVGFGERCGNANLSTLLGCLQGKLGYALVPDLTLLKETAHYIAEVANLALPGTMPYVGSSAFSHKGGMHVDGVAKNPVSFEHIPPESVGNKRSFLLSEMSGRSTLVSKLRQIEPSLDRDGREVGELVEKIKSLEHEGFQFEAADASFTLMVLKHLGRFTPYFEIVDYHIIAGAGATASASASAMIKVKVGSRYEITADEGDGPVNAIDKALRKALEVFYPALSRMRLSDYKVRVVDTGASTAAVTRVLIESTDGARVWTTVGASKDIINASMLALLDSLEYMLYHHAEYNYSS